MTRYLLILLIDGRYCLLSEVILLWHGQEWNYNGTTARGSACVVVR